MEKHKLNNHCTCKVGLGVANLLEGDNQKPDIKERRKKILNESIHFLGNCNVSQKCKIIDKINELKNIISEYYFDSDNKLIVIPNQIVLEDKPRILEYENERARNKFLDSHLENILHQSTANALREKKIEALLFQGFQSDLCLRDKLDKCKNMRNEDKKGSNLSYPDLNRHELDVMEMLDIEHLSDVDLVEIINQHESKVLGRVVEDSSWIVSQVWSKMQKKVLESIPFDHLKTFYKYQWFRCNVDCNFNEYDTLLVIPQSKLIINIEVKRGSTLSVLKKAADQTRKHRNFFSSLFGPMLSEKWKFVKAACMPHIDFGSIMNSPCSYCKQFIVRESNLNNMRQWISTLTDNEPETNVDEYQTEYENLLVALIGLSSLKHSNQQNSLVVDPLELSKQTENKITGRNLGIDGESEHDRENLEKAVDGTKTDFDNLCYMLTPSQLNAVKNLSNFFIIDGDMGTGKTYVLKERVKRCANKFPTDTILYVDLSSTDIWTNIYAYEFRYKVNDLKPNPVKECDESKEDFDHRFYEFQPTGEMEDQKTLMTMIAEIDFESNKKIKVVTAREIQLNYDLRYKARHLKEGRRVPFTWMLKDYLSRIKFDHVFIDEMRMQNEIIDFFSTGAKSYCVVLKSYTNHQVRIKKRYKDDLFWYDPRLEFNKYIKWTRIMKREYGAVRISLEKNMRNSENVLHLASSLTPAGFDFIDNSGSLVSPTKNVFGPSCYHYENTQWLDPGLLVRAILKKYFADRPREVIVVLTENLDDVEEDREVYQYLQKYNSEGRNIVLLPSTKQPTDQDVEKNIKNFIRNSEGILVTSLKQFHGAQARNLVLFAGMSLNNSKLRDAILRAMSFAIVIHVEHIKRPNLWVFEDTNLHDFIDYTEEYRRNSGLYQQDSILEKAFCDRRLNAFYKKIVKESQNGYYVT